MATSVTPSEDYKGPSAISIPPSGGATGTSGGTSTTTLTCTPCCAPATNYLAGWFGSSGLCPGAVNNTVPVTLNASFSFTVNSPYTLSGLCLPASGTLSMTANNPSSSYQQYLYWSSPTTCTTVSPPTTRLQGKTGLIPYWVLPSGNIRTVYPYICNCYSFGYINLYISETTAPTYSCSPFSITFNGTMYDMYTPVGTFSVTFTP